VRAHNGTGNQGPWNPALLFQLYRGDWTSHCPGWLFIPAFRVFCSTRLGTISIVEDPNIQVQGYLSNSDSAYRVPCHCVCRPLLVEEGCHLSDSLCLCFHCHHSRATFQRIGDTNIFLGTTSIALPNCCFVCNRLYLPRTFLGLLLPNSVQASTRSIYVETTKSLGWFIVSV